jgi:hypothetical protein
MTLALLKLLSASELDHLAVHNAEIARFVAKNMQEFGFEEMPFLTRIVSTANINILMHVVDAYETPKERLHIWQTANAIAHRSDMSQSFQENITVHLLNLYVDIQKLLPRPIKQYLSLSNLCFCCNNAAEKRR